MKLLSSSILEGIDSFLHAGYISAHPRALFPHAYPHEPKDLESFKSINLNEALRLESAESGGDSAAAAVSGFSDLMSDGRLLIIGTLSLVVLILTAWLLRHRSKRALQYAGLAAAMCSTFFLFANCGAKGTGPPSAEPRSTEQVGEAPLPLIVPWQGLDKRSYENPKLATVVILRGIIAPALSNVPRQVGALEELRDEVGLPTNSPTEGMRYAIKTYGLDGWGGEIRLNAAKSKVRTLTSAGPDGSFDSEDDIVVDVRFTTNDTWGFHRSAFYLAEHDSELKVFFHAWKNEMAKSVNSEMSKALTGTNLFDCFTIEDLPKENWAMAKAAFEKHGEGGARDTIVLQYWDKLDSL